MYKSIAPVVSPETTMKEYRKDYNEKQREWMSPENRQLFRENFKELVDVIFVPRQVDVREFKGSEEELVKAVDNFYFNDGRAFNPNLTYPPNMIDSFGKDYALNARGIYYFNDFKREIVTVDRKVWIPSFEDTDWEDPSESSRRRRARIVVEHNIDNEKRHKSEYAWEADAWADVFSQMRNDPCLEVDKHDYITEMDKTHEVLCTLTGETKVVNRIPDATFGLATFSEIIKDNEVQPAELSRELLEDLMLHPKCGLLSDPKWGETDLVFPFAVYEAKGWSGDCREARRQACQGAACYLDMLDNLARTPGPINSTKVYQTKTSHQYQVFALTSYGAHWHLLVGYRRPRQEGEYAGTKGLSDNVYIFQRIWSARVTNDRAAWELLSLIDQIHLWAITEFRTYVTDHLKPWHKFCTENFLYDWDSVYDVKQELKRPRIFSEDKDLSLPSWTKLLNKPMQQKLQEKAQNVVVKVFKEAFAWKEKRKSKPKYGWRMGCNSKSCPGNGKSYSSDEFFDHFRDGHGFSIADLINFEDILDEVCAAKEKKKESEGEQKESEKKEEKDDEICNKGGEVCTSNKRSRVEEEYLERGPPGPSTECMPGPSKRIRVV